MEFNLEDLITTYVGSFVSQGGLAVAVAGTVVMASGLGARAIELWERVSPVGRVHQGE